jgi:putative endonuclease
VPRHFVYILECADGSLYTGYTTDPTRRFREHSSGRGSRYTRTRRPLKLSYVEERESRNDALRREIQIKRMSRREKKSLCRRRWKSGKRSPR